MSRQLCLGADNRKVRNRMVVKATLHFDESQVNSTKHSFAQSPQTKGHDKARLESHTKPGTQQQ